MQVLERSPLAVLGDEVEVTLADGRRVRHANLDIAASAPCAAVAAEAVQSLLPFYASVHRGAGALSQRCTRAYEDARRVAAEFVGCRGDDDQVVFTRNTTDALNLLARCLPPGTTVLTFTTEHHANLLPWTRVRRLGVPESGEAAVRSVAGAVRGIEGPVLVAVTGASNVTGELWPVREIAEVAHRYGARVVVDAAQLAAHRPVRLAELGADYLALSGHKLYAPFGVGVLAGRGDWLDAAAPYLAGGGASAAVSMDGAVRWARGPARHEAGTPNLVGAVALAAVCAWLTPDRWAALIARERALRDRLCSGLASIDRVRLLRLFDSGHPRVGVVAFAVSGMDSATVAARLAAEHGVGVRDGLFCAHPLTRHLLAGSGPNPPATAVRASLGAGSTEEHVDRLLEGVRAIVSSPTAYP